MKADEAIKLCEKLNELEYADCEADVMGSGEYDYSLEITFRVPTNDRKEELISDIWLKNYSCSHGQKTTAELTIADIREAIDKSFRYAKDNLTEKAADETKRFYVDTDRCSSPAEVLTAFEVQEMDIWKIKRDVEAWKDDFETIEDLEKNTDFILENFEKEKEHEF